MPLAKPNTGEDRSAFVKRCMIDPNTLKEFPDQKNRLGYCEGAFETNADANEFVNISDMEVFKEGTHNGHTFKAKDIDEIVNNFNTLKNQLTPKVKISHGKKQQTIAGLASYGDVTRVLAKTIGGVRKIFVDLANVPEQVAQWIKDRRFGERSVEIFPTIKINGKTFKNVLAKVALLGHQIPAVAGMSPVDVKLEIENEYKLNGDDLKDYESAEHFEYTIDEKDNNITVNFNRKEGQMDKELLDAIAGMEAQLKGLEGKLDTEDGKKAYGEMKTKIESFKSRIEDAEKGQKSAEEDVTKLTKDNQDKDDEIKKFKKEKVDANTALKNEKISTFVSDLKKNGKITPAVEKDLTTLLYSLDDSEKTLEFTTKLKGGGDVKQKETQLESAKRILFGLSTVVEFGEMLSHESDDDTTGGSQEYVTIHGTTYELDGVDDEKAIDKYMQANKCDLQEATRVILDAKEKKVQK